MSIGIALLLSLIGLLAHFGLLILAIRLASEKERKFIKIQTAIMAKMAQQSGISKQDIDELFIKEKLRIL